MASLPAGQPEPGLRLIRSAELSGATAQTTGMIRSAAISGDLVGATSLWMGRTVLPPLVSSGDHHHGESEMGIFVVSGQPVFVFRDPPRASWSGCRRSPATTSGSRRTHRTGRRTRRPPRTRSW